MSRLEGQSHGHNDSDRQMQMQPGHEEFKLECPAGKTSSMWTLLSQNVDTMSKFVTRTLVIIAASTCTLEPTPHAG